MQIESCGYSRAKSVADAKGLFQVMPQHFSNVDKSYDPEKNAEKALTYLKKCLNASGSTRLALACYNGGITRAKSPEEDWPYETQRYVYWGLKIYKDAKLYKDYSPRLNEWLNSGGDHLCRLAAREQNGKK